MQRARRLTSIAISAVLGVTALSACRSEPGVAAYIGDRKITEDQVSAILDDARSKVPPGGHVAGATPAPEQPEGAPPQATEVKAPTRSAVVSALVVGDICRRLATEKGFQPKEQAPVDRFAEQMGLPAGSDHVRNLVELDACLAGMPAGNPVAPTPEEMADLVARGKAAGVVPPEVKVEEAATQLDGELLRGRLAMRNTLAEALKTYRVTVSPRYRPLEYTVLPFSDGTPALAVQVAGGGSDTVIDAR
ncbi:hypothetical protein [Plantactinospora sp. CA-290183]|uniref:hypothetical protein n=1 Tax=Plantactinospora sp. CA-290183 TaxID=3240006 RepID=UPI003D91F099